MILHAPTLFSCTLLLATLVLTPLLPAQVDSRQEKSVEITFGEEGISLEKALQWASASTGVPLMHKPNDFRSKPKLMLTGKVTVERPALMEFWQGVFKTQGFAMLRVNRGGSEVINIEPIDSSRVLKQSARYVDEKDIASSSHRPGEVIMTTIKLHHVPVKNVRGAVTQLLTNRAAEFAQEVQGSNSLMVVGFGPTIQALHRVLKTMDVPAIASKVEFEAINLTYANAKQITPVLSNLVDGSTPKAVGGRPIDYSGLEKPDPRIIADGSSNRLLIHATAEDLSQIKAIIKTLDVRPLDHQSTTIYALKHADAHDILRTVHDLYSEPSSGPGVQRSIPFRIVHDQRTNAIILRCSKSLRDEIQPLIESLDRKIDDK